MSTCIDLFKKIPAVVCILTYARHKPDTAYRLQRAQWVALWFDRRKNA